MTDSSLFVGAISGTTVDVGEVVNKGFRLCYMWLLNWIACICRTFC